jgi:hypothetical protein
LKVLSQQLKQVPVSAFLPRAPEISPTKPPAAFLVLQGKPEKEAFERGIKAPAGSLGM